VAAGLLHNAHAAAYMICLFLALKVSKLVLSTAAAQQSLTLASCVLLIIIIIFM